MTEGIGLEKTKVKVDPRGFIEVDGLMRTGEPNVYAIGDIVPTPALAHCAFAEGILAVEHIAGKDVRPLNYDRVPNATYTDPEVAWVGLTETEAKASGAAYGKATFPWAASGRSLTLGRTEGVTKLLFDEASGRLVGCGIVGCGIYDMKTPAEFGQAIAIARGTPQNPLVEPEDLLKARIVDCTPKAKTYGIQIGMTGREAVKAGVGGEVLCNVW